MVIRGLEPLLCRLYDFFHYDFIIRFMVANSFTVDAVFNTNLIHYNIIMMSAAINKYYNVIFVALVESSQSIIRVINSGV